jgi:hypothetical protein
MKRHASGLVDLCIHDSVIVEEQYAELLQEIMTQVYEEERNFSPEVKITN